MGRPLIVDESIARMRNEGGGFAANIYGAMPEGLLMAGFPFRISYHRSLDRERKRFLASFEMTIRGSDVS